MRSIQKETANRPVAQTNKRSLNIKISYILTNSCQWSCNYGGKDIRRIPHEEYCETKSKQHEKGDVHFLTNPVACLLGLF